MKNFFHNLKFRYQLLISMLTITTLVLYFIVQISYTYFNNRNLNEVQEKARLSVMRASSSLSTQFQNLSTATNQLMVKPPFPQMILDINSNSFHGYSKYFSSATEEAEAFLQNQDLVNNILILGEDNIFYSPYSLGISQNVEQLFSENIWDYSAITVFPIRANSLFKHGTIIPISFPVSRSSSSGTLSYQDMTDTQRARLVLMLDSSQIRAYFDRMSNNYTYCMYLTSQDGLPLDIMEPSYPDLFLPEIRQEIAEAENAEFQITVGNDQFFISVSPLHFCGLKAVHVMKQSSLMGDSKTLQSFFIASWLICLVVAGILSFSLSSILTRKLKAISNIITRINNNSYQEKIVFQHTDEISLLGTQLNHMYDTIEQQLEQIKDEEQKKALAEIQMMSEQINPHFLYNTLECIHFQILNQNSSLAGEMLESLGRYLRITLSVGETMIPIKKEIEHVTLYMEIMNRHSPNGYRFDCQVDPGLTDCKIMKVLLQPLVENCIKHGFHGSITGLELVPPQITVTIGYLNSSMIRIEVSDNGEGIDIQKASSCLNANSKESEKHFGLQNIQKRLNSCYHKQAAISFISIPYLKNSVIIDIPKSPFMP